MAATRRNRRRRQRTGGQIDRPASTSPDTDFDDYVLAPFSRIPGDKHPARWRAFSQEPSGIVNHPTGFETHPTARSIFHRPDATEQRRQYWRYRNGLHAVPLAATTDRPGGTGDVTRSTKSKHHRHIPGNRRYAGSAAPTAGVGGDAQAALWAV